jgi:hypothetical protein
LQATRVRLARFVVLEAAACSTIRSFDGHIAKGTIMDTLLIIIVLLILFGEFGGGYYGYSHYGMGGGIGYSA